MILIDNLHAGGHSGRVTHSPSTLAIGREKCLQQIVQNPFMNKSIVEEAQLSRKAYTKMAPIPCPKTV